MADKIDMNEFFPSIPNVAEGFKMKHAGEEHTPEEWWDLFVEYLDANTEEVDTDGD